MKRTYVTISFYYIHYKNIKNKTNKKQIKDYLLPTEGTRYVTSIRSVFAMLRIQKPKNLNLHLHAYILSFTTESSIYPYEVFECAQT